MAVVGAALAATGLIVLNAAGGVLPNTSAIVYRGALNLACQTVARDFTTSDKEMISGGTSGNDVVFAHGFESLLADSSALDRAITETPLPTVQRSQYKAAKAPVAQQAAELRALNRLPGNAQLDGAQSQAVLKRLVTISSAAAMSLNGAGITSCGAIYSTFATGLTRLVVT